MKWPHAQFPDGTRRPLNELPTAHLYHLATSQLLDMGNPYNAECRAIAAKLVQERAQ